MKKHTCKPDVIDAFEPARRLLDHAYSIIECGPQPHFTKEQEREFRAAVDLLVSVLEALRKTNLARAFTACPRCFEVHPTLQVTR